MELIEVSWNNSTLMPYALVCVYVRFDVLDTNMVLPNYLLRCGSVVE